MVKIINNAICYDECYDYDFSLINNAVLSYLLELNSKKVDSINKSVVRSNEFYVSQSSFDCYRKIYFEMRYPRNASEDKLGLLAGGNFIHDVYQTALKSIGADINVVCSKCFNDSILMKGSCDVVFNKMVGEIKSVQSFAWKYIAGGHDKYHNIIPASPKIAHIRQLNMYMELLGITDGFLLYVNKDGIVGENNTKMFKIKKDISQVNQTIGRCIIVFNAINENRVPEKIKGKECTYCNHTDLCKLLV